MDHSVVQELIDSGLLDADAAARRLPTQRHHARDRRRAATPSRTTGSSPPKRATASWCAPTALPSELDADAHPRDPRSPRRTRRLPRRGSCTRPCVRGGRDNITALVVDAAAVRSRAVRVRRPRHDAGRRRASDEIDGDTRPRVARRRRFLMSVRYSPGRHARRGHPARLRGARRGHSPRARRPHPRARRRRPWARRGHRSADRAPTARRSRPSRPSPSRSRRASRCASRSAASSRSWSRPTGAIDEISGSGVTTWSERVPPAVSRITVTAAAGARRPSCRCATASCSPRGSSGMPRPRRLATVEPVIDSGPARRRCARRPDLPSRPCAPAPALRLRGLRSSCGARPSFGRSATRSSIAESRRRRDRRGRRRAADDVVVVAGDHDGETISLAQAQALRAGDPTRRRRRSRSRARPRPAGSACRPGRS